MQTKQFASEESLLIIVGNKIDLDGDRTVSCEKGRQYALSHGLSFFEISCKTAENIPSLVKYSMKKRLVQNNQNNQNNMVKDSPKSKGNRCALN